MRTIVAPLYIRPVVITDEDSFLFTGAEKRVEYHNILTWGDKRLKVLLAYLIELPLDDLDLFCRLVEMIGYSPFLEIAPLEGLVEIALKIEQPERVPRYMIASLFHSVKKPLEDFRPEIIQLYRRLDKARDLRAKKRLLLDCWRKARDYGFAHHFTEDRNGLPVHIIEGADVRAGALIGLALHLEKRGSFPRSPYVKKCQLPGCDSPINPLLYGGRRYCSDACRRRAAITDRSRLVNRIQVKAARAVKRGGLSERDRRAMLDEMKGAKTLKKVREIALRYGVNPERERAGRKPYYTGP